MARQKNRTCIACNQPFKGRPNAKTCSAKCRKRLQRAKLLLQKETGQVKAIAKRALIEAEDIFGAVESHMAPQATEAGFVSTPTLAEQPTITTPVAGPPPLRPEATLATPISSVAPVPPPPPTPPATPTSFPITPPSLPPSPDNLFPTTRPAPPPESLDLPPAGQTLPAAPSQSSVPHTPGNVFSPTTQASGSFNPLFESDAGASSLGTSQGAVFSPPIAPPPLSAGPILPTNLSNTAPAIPKNPRFSIPHLGFGRSARLALASTLVISLVAIGIYLLGNQSAQNKANPTAGSTNTYNSSSTLNSTSVDSFHLNVDTFIDNGHNLTVSGAVLIQNAAGDTPALQVNGDINATGSINAGTSLSASGGATSLSNAGLTINNTLICTANGCSTLAAQAASGRVFTGDADTLNGQPGSFYQNSSNQNAGTLSDQRLSSNVALLNSNQTFSGINSFVSGSNTFTGDGSGLSAVNAALLNGHNGAFYNNASNLNAGTVNDARLSANVALLNANNTFTGTNTFSGVTIQNGGFLFQSATNALNAFQIQNAAGNDNLLIADTINTRIGIGVAAPNYTLDVNGDVNIANGQSYRINGVVVCSNVGCTPSGSSNNYIQLQATTPGTQQSGNANISGALITGSVSGNGLGLTNLDASQIAQGTLNDLRLSANVTRQGNSFNGATQLVQTTNLSYFPGLNGSLITNLDAGAIATGTLNDLRLSSNVPLKNASNTFSGATNSFSNAITIPGFNTTNSGHIINVGFTNSASGNRTFNFDLANTQATQTICTVESGNCAGSGSGVTASGTSSNFVPKFTTNGQTLGNSKIYDNGTNIYIGQTTGVYPLDVVGDINSSTGLRVGGTLLCTASGCGAAAGSGNYIQNGTGTQTSANFNIRSASSSGVVGVLEGASGQSVDLLDVQNFGGGTKYLRVTTSGLNVAGNVDVSGQFSVSGTQISSANLSNDANLAKLNGTGPQAFTGNNSFAGTLLQKNTGTAVFQIQKADGTGTAFTADTSNTRIGIGTAPAYTLDVAGDVNISTGSSYRINGTAICGPSATCAPSSGSTSYIQNGVAQQTNANFNIQSTATGSVVGLLQGKSGQTADILDLKDGSGNLITSVGNNGQTVHKDFTAGSATFFQIQNSSSVSLLTANTTTGQILLPNANLSSTALLFGGDANLYRSSVSTLKTDGNLVVAGTETVNGAVLLENTANSTTAFQLQNQSGQNLLAADTTNMSVNVTNGSLSQTLTTLIYKGGGDVSGSTNSGAGNQRFNYTAVSGHYLYAVANGNATACSSTPGSAIGCELQVYDVTRPTSPTYIAGVDASGSTGSGTGNNGFNSIAISGHYAYVVGNNNATACSSTAGSAIGCELQAYDISNPSSPTYVAGVDATGTVGSGTGNSQFVSIAVSGRYAYITKGGASAACSSTPGSAIGCELQVYDISNPASPIYVGGADTSGSTNSGTGAQQVNYVTVSGRYAYVVTSGNSTACSQSAGSAIGCELQVYDISNPASPTYVGGADTSGSTNSGISGNSLVSVVVSGRYAYVVQNNGNATTCSSTPGSAIGCELQVYDISNPASPIYVGGADVTGSTNSGTGSDILSYIAVVGRYAYVTKSSNSTACSSTPGSAIGCELQVYDISNPASPTYVAGVDASGSAGSGTGSNTVDSVTVAGRYIYVSNSGNATACSQSVGSAIGCELQVYDTTGIEATAATIHSLESGTLQVDQNGQVAGDFNIQGALSVGQSLQVNGSLDASGVIALRSSGSSSQGVSLNMVVTSSVNAHDVVIIDTGNAGQVTTVGAAGSTGVFGVATTTNSAGVAQGIVVSGVYQITADTNAVNVGDVLVTSVTTGQVASSTTPSSGTVIGRALSAKAAGSSGLVWVYITPGVGGGGPGTGASNYGLMESDWVDTGATLPGVLGSSSIATIGNKVYLFGGDATGAGTYSNKIYSAPVSNPTNWTDTGSTLPGTLGFAQLAIIGGNIYLYGGASGGVATNVIYTSTTANPTSWSNTGATLPANLTLTSLAVIGSTIYLFGGETGSPVNKIYSASTSTPTSFSDTGATLPGVLEASSLAVIGNYIYLFGGHNASAYTNVIYRAPVSNPLSWSNTGGTLPAALAYSSLAIIGNYVYLFGGATTGTNGLNIIYKAPINNPVNGWTNAGSTLPAARWVAQTAIIGNAIYYLGGQNTGGTPQSNIYSAPIFNGSPDISPNPSWKTATNVASGGGNSTGSAATSTELAYNQFTSDVNPINATTEGTANTVVTATSITSDGATPIQIQFYAPSARPDTTAANRNIFFYLYQDGSSIGQLSKIESPNVSGVEYMGVYDSREITPSAGSHTYSIRASVDAGSGVVNAGAGGSGNVDPGYIRIVLANPLQGGTNGGILNGTTTQAGNFNVQSNNANNAAGILKGASSQSADIFDVQNSSGTNLLRVDPSGNVSAANTIGFTGTGNTNQGITTNFIVTSSVNANDVVAIDTNNAGQLTTTTTQGSTKVFGIATLTKTAGNSQPIVVSGIYQVTADTNAVNIGDFLIASSTAGQVVSSGSPSAGSVIGRALSAKAGGSSGLVWIQVTPGLGGGGGSSGGLQSYGLMESDWTNTGSTLPVNLGDGMIATIGSKVYIFGGNNGSITNTIYSAPVSNPTNWSNTGLTLPAALNGSSLAIIGGTIYLFGGSGNSGDTNVIYSAPVANPTSWSNTGSTIPANLSFSQLAIIGNTIYLFGGLTGGSGTNAIYTASVSNPTSWSTSGSTLPGATRDSQLLVIGNYVYLFGGSGPSNAIYRAPISNPLSWTSTGGTLPGSLRDSQPAIIGNYIYLFGGGSPSAVNVIYRAPINNPVNGWVNIGSVIPAALSDSQFAIIGNAAYLFGGYNGGYVNSIYSAPVFTNSPDTTANPSWKVAANTSSGGGSSTAGQLDYKTFTSPVSITATSEGTSQTVIAGNAVNYDGSTQVKIDFWAPYANWTGGSQTALTMVLYRDGTPIGQAISLVFTGAQGETDPLLYSILDTPSAGSHTYTMKAFQATGGSSVNVDAGAGGSGAAAPGYLRVTTANGTGGNAGSVANGTALQTGNFNIQSAGAGLVAASIQGASGQTANLLNILSGTGVNLLSVDPNGLITLGPASATPDILVLGTKNTSGDPTCTNGGIYYNSNSTQIRGCINGAYNNLGGTNTGTSIPTTNLYDGRTFRLRVGSSPYNFVDLVYDGTYAKWVSAPQVAAQITVQNATTSSTYTGLTVNSASTTVPGNKDLYNAGLRMQLYSEGYLDRSAGGTTSFASVGLNEFNSGDSANGTGLFNGQAEISSSTAAVEVSSGWVAAGYNLATPTKDFAKFYVQVKQSGGGTAYYGTGGGSTVWYRWVSQ